MSNTPYVLPDNPSDKGFSASQIKFQMYSGFLILFKWLSNLQVESSNAFINSTDEINIILEAIDNINKSLQSHELDITSIKNDIDTIRENITAIDNKYSIKCNEIIESLTKISSNLDSLNTKTINLEASLRDGSFVVNKALSDSLGNNISNTYVKNSKIASSKTSVDTTLLPTLGIVKELINDLSNMIVNGSAESLNTLKELADALGNDPNFATTITNLISTKLSITEAISTYLTKSDALNTYSTIEKVNSVESKIDNFVGTWSEIPKLSYLGDGRYSITYEDWIGSLGNGRYALVINQ